MAEIDVIRDRRWQVIRQAASRWKDRQYKREDNSAAVERHGVGAADSPQRNQRMEARQALFESARAMRALHSLPKAFERRMGPTLDWADVPPSEAARHVGRPVARIVDRIGTNTVPEAFGTGFLIAPQLLMTNHHVLASRSEAIGRGANFLYETTENGLMRGVQFELDPDAFFLTDEALDYTIVGVNGRSIEGTSITDIGFITLIEATPKILIGEPVHIIQYPEGTAKKYAYRNNRLLDIIEDGFLHYFTDTLEGSSGSPGFSRNWELVCLHHASIPKTDETGNVLDVNNQRWSPEDGDDAVNWISNEGIRVSAMVKNLPGKVGDLKSDSQIRQLQDLLRSTADPVDELVALSQSSGREGLPPTRSLDFALNRSGMNAMANVFNFSGPVTIHVYSAAPVLEPQAPKQKVAAVEKKLRVDPDYDSRPGYDTKFLGPDEKHLWVPVPRVSSGRMKDMLKDTNGDQLILPYHHYSLAMNKSRRLQMWSAANVNYAKDVKFKGDRKSFGTDTWIADPRISEEDQITDPEFYKPAKNIDRGHMVRREDNCWGTDEDEIEFSNSDTFHWTNCTPQHEAFNQSAPARSDAIYRGMKGLWGDFENHVQTELASDDDKACILSGPVLGEDDPDHDFGSGKIQYPLSFWKVVVVAVPTGSSNGKSRALAAHGFVFSQRDVVDKYGIERFRPDRFRVYQRSLKSIEKMTGIVFDAALHTSDTI